MAAPAGPAAAGAGSGPAAAVGAADGVVDVTVHAEGHGPRVIQVSRSLVIKDIKRMVSDAGVTIPVAYMAIHASVPAPDGTAAPGAALTPAELRARVGDLFDDGPSAMFIRVARECQCE